MSMSAIRASKKLVKSYVSPPNKVTWNIIVPLMKKKKQTGSDIAIAALFDEKNHKIEIVKSYFSAPQTSDHPLDTPIINLILHACQDYDRKLFIVATCAPTIFERETIKIMGIDRIFYPVSEEKFVVLAQKNRKLKEKNIEKPKQADLSLAVEDMVNIVHDAIEEVKVNEKGRLRTHDSFLWCEDLKSVDCPQLLQDELYMGLLYSSLFILWNDTARPVDHTGRFPVAAMLVDSNNKPIAFSINTSKGDNSIAHAETGMLLRYFNGRKIRNLPAGSKLYTTLESCEMCRAGLSLVKDSTSEFKELYGKKDDKVTCQIYADYSLSPYSPSNEYLRRIDLKEDKKFYDFCRANYLAMKSFLEDEGLKSRFSQFFENIQILWNQINGMRMRPWVGNSLLYDLPDDPSDPTWFVVKQKTNFQELYRYYYGDNISELLIEEKGFHAKGKTQVKGRIKIGDFFHASGEGGSLTITNSRLISNQPQPLRIPKDSIRKQLVRTGFTLDEKKLIGDYTPTLEDGNLKKELFINVMSYTTITEEMHEIALKWWGESDIMKYLTGCYEKDAEWFKENLNIHNNTQLDAYSIIRLIWLRKDGNHEAFREKVFHLFVEFGMPRTYLELVELIRDQVLPESVNDRSAGITAISTAHPSSLVDYANVTSASIHSRNPGIGLHPPAPKTAGTTPKHTAIPPKDIKPFWP